MVFNRRHNIMIVLRINNIVLKNKNTLLLHFYKFFY